MSSAGTSAHIGAMTANASELHGPDNGMTLAQMREAAVAVFGPDASVDYAEYEGWVIRTTIPEKVDPSVFAGTPAAEGYSEWDRGESVLERWMRKNGRDGSIAIGAEEYNREFTAVPTPEMTEADDREDFELLQDYIRRDNDFSDANLAAHRDEVLAKARNYGWIQ